MNTGYIDDENAAAENRKLKKTLSNHFDCNRGL